MADLDLALTLATKNLKICNDSQLVVGKIQEEYDVKDECMVRYLKLVQANLAKLSEWVIERIPLTRNLKADTLGRITATLPMKEAFLLPIYLQVTSSIVVASVCSTNESDTDWMHEIVKYL